jgi:hypothetical protein
MALWRLKRSSLRDDPMSALGQKQTFALQKVMSALPPKAGISWRQSSAGINATLVVGNVGKHVRSPLPDGVLVAAVVKEFGVEVERHNVVR